VNEAAAHAEYQALAIDGNLHVPVLIALLMRGEEVLAPVFDPLHGTIEHAGRYGDADVLRIERALRAEAAADVRRHHAHLMIAQIEHVEHAALQAMRPL
jgi:hypothetical protein